MTTISEIVATVAEPAGADIRPEIVKYEQAGTALEGVLVKDRSVSGRRPAVLVIHDWYGVDDYETGRATMLARLGYVAFAADIFGAGVRPDDSTAAQTAGSYYADLPLLRARATAGLEALLADPDVDPERVVVIGYCFGGSTALELARTGAPLAGAVSFHGGLIAHDPSDADRIRGRLLVLTGADDPVVPDSAVNAFEDELRAVPALDWQVTTYAGAMHSFTVPTADAPDHGAQYHARADARSWKAFTTFLEDVFAA